MIRFLIKKAEFIVGAKGGCSIASRRAINEEGKLLNKRIIRMKILH